MWMYLLIYFALGFAFTAFLIRMNGWPKGWDGMDADGVAIFAFLFWPLTLALSLISLLYHIMVDALRWAGDAE